MKEQAEMARENNHNSPLVEASQNLATSISPFLPAEILALVLEPQWKRSEDRKTWREMANILLSCRELRYLAGDHNPLDFASDTSLPEYPYLKKLKVHGQDIHLLAPLLRRLYNLESLELLWGNCHMDGD
ncbi:hypothetical protein DFH29DRAFT_1083155 [Suillus ampliporus]|nr:hypothetical protein DFH29DRAFT_1083155 [Suillus ampliporus]